VTGCPVRVVAPTGHYVNTRAISLGSNRWALKPEVSVSRRLLVDVYGGVWLFTAKDDYFAGSDGAPGAIRTQEPIAAFETHVSDDVTPRLWVSVDVNYWYGGRTSLNGVRARHCSRTPAWG
jgi:hypothetical protein